ncbi:MAG: glycine cleavage system protein H [Burkholderiaceae bacterium]
MNVLDGLSADVLYAPEQDMWVRLEADGTARVGATHLVAMHGQFMTFTPRPAGTEVQRDRSLGVMETAKTAVAMHAPLSCKVIETNSSAVDNIHLVITDPYGSGWLFKVEPTNLEAECGSLLQVAAYREWVEPRLGDKLAPPIDEFDTDDFDIDPNRGY